MEEQNKNHNRKYTRAEQNEIEHNINNNKTDEECIEYLRKRCGKEEFEYLFKKGIDEIRYMDRQYRIYEFRKKNNLL